jgi:hypothetical protein
LDEDELLELLGDTLLGSSVGFGSEDIERKLRFARSWLERKRDDFRSHLCDEVFKKLQNRDTLDAVMDAAVVADALVSALGHQTANVVAVILLRRGLNELCSGQ